MNRLKTWLEKNSEQLVINLLHVVAWSLYLSFYWVSFIPENPSREYRLLYVLFIAIKDIAVFYYFYRVGIPKMLAGRKVWLFILMVLLITGMYPLVSWAMDQVLLYYYAEVVTAFTNISTSQFPQIYAIRAVSCLFVILMAGMGKFTFDWFKNMRIRKELENQNLTSELAFLKSQINPHFLFNTLNNIHTLAYKKADGAPEAIMKLSDLMRYMLYESDIDRVPLKTEVEHLKSFIGLQELRFKSGDVVELKIAGDIEKRTIAPLLLLPFVENAFKHGYKLNRPGAIKIHLNVGTDIQFSIENECAPGGILQQKDEVGGIGLENISRRLELIYQDHYTLEVDHTSSYFKATLTLKHE